MSDDDFASFVHTSGPRLMRYAVLLTGHRGDAEDLLQEALMRAYPRWHSLRDQQPEAYVRKTMANRLVSRWRSPWTRRRVSAVPERADPANEHGRIDDRDELLTALRSLPPRMRAVMVLRYWLECSEKETAAELGCSVGAVKSQASRGLQRMRAALDGAMAPGTNGGR